MLDAAADAEDDAVAAAADSDADDANADSDAADAVADAGDANAAGVADVGVAADAAPGAAAPFPIPWSVWLRHQPAADVRSFSIAALVRKPVGPDQQAAVTVSRVH